MNDTLLHLFFVANSASYPDKKEEFYPLKHKILNRFGIPDGWDLQIVIKECWVCDGTGNDNYGWAPENSEEEIFCDSCAGTGIYRQDHIRLDRYRLGNRIYHSPRFGYVVDPNELDYKAIIKGLIEHSTEYSAEYGHQACLYLTKWWKALALQDAVLGGQGTAVCPHPWDAVLGNQKA